MGPIRRLQELRKKRSDQNESSERRPQDEPNARLAEEQAAEIERQRREQETLFRTQQAEQARRMQEINDRVDQQTTANSEEFLGKIKQPGGQ